MPCSWPFRIACMLAAFGTSGCSVQLQASDMSEEEGLRSAARSEARPLAMLDLRRPLSRRKGKRRLWLFGAHHKAGTVLMHRLAMIQGRETEEQACSISNVYGPCGHFGPSCWTAPSVRIWFDCHMSATSLQKVRERSAGTLRAVHIIRDPVALVVSAYVYHMRSNDGARTELIRHVNVSNGVQLEAEAALKETLPEMLSAYRDGLVNRDVLVVRLEDFMSSSTSFNATVRKVYHHTVGDSAHGRVIERMVSLATQEDLSQHPVYGHSSSTNPILKREAESAVQWIPDRLMRQLREYQSALGYA
mmetsp:Transcript_35708/g.111035  ORF Transcript_35708/g.111035 Transcript_35708/m.111035 type:complete len:304 (+) Transcript_35708:123-1034(+)